MHPVARNPYLQPDVHDAGVRKASCDAPARRFENLEAHIAAQTDPTEERRSWNAVLTKYDLRCAGFDDEVTQYVLQQVGS